MDAVPEETVGNVCDNESKLVGANITGELGRVLDASRYDNGSRSFMRLQWKLHGF